MKDWECLDVRTGKSRMLTREERQALMAMKPPGYRPKPIKREEVFLGTMSPDFSRIHR